MNNKVNKKNDDNISLFSRSLGPNGRNVFEDALKLRINSKLIIPIRIINTMSNCWVSNVQITKTYYPIQTRKERYEEIRYRSVGISVGSSSNITIYDSESGDVIYNISGITCRITSLSLSLPPIGKDLVPLFATGDNDGYIKVYDLQSGELLTPNLANHKHIGPINSVYINEIMKSYVFAAIDNQVYAWKYESEIIDTIFNDHIACCKCISGCSQRNHGDIDYSIVCSGGHDGFIYGYDLLTLQKIITLEVKLLINTINVKFISSTEVCLVLGSFEGDIVVYELTKQTLLHHFHGSDEPIYSVVIIDTIIPAFIFAGASLDIKIYDLRQGVHLITLYSSHIDCIRSIDVTVDPRLIIVSGGYDNKTIVYDLHRIAQNDDNVRLLLSHLKLKSFKFERKHHYLFNDDSIDDTNSIITEPSTYLIDSNTKQNDIDYE